MFTRIRRSINVDNCYISAGNAGIFSLCPWDLPFLCFFSGSYTMHWILLPGYAFWTHPQTFCKKKMMGNCHVLQSNISSLPHWQRHSMKCVFLYGTHELYISIYDQREWAQDRNFNVTSSLKLPWICWIKSLSLFGGAVNYWKLHSVYIHYTPSVQMSCTKDSAKKLEPLIDTVGRIKWPVCSECRFALIV